MGRCCKCNAKTESGEWCGICVLEDIGNQKYTVKKCLKCGKKKKMKEKIFLCRSCKISNRTKESFYGDC